MVNVGGRSRGCSPCRRRRVKCDESRPICDRCQRASLECTGPKDIAFVEGRIVKSRRTEKRVHVSPPVDTSSVFRPSSLPAPLTGDKFETCICFARNFILRGGAIDLALQDIQISDIVKSGTAAANDQTFHQAFLSFSLIMFGSRHGQAHLVDQGYLVHGMALRQLNQTLSDSSCHTCDMIFLSIATLALMECFVPTGPKHYIKHMIALERLLELRGPSSEYSSKFSRFYKSVRHMLIFASLRTGKASILARAEWKTLLRAQCSEEEMQQQELFEVLADCTVLVAARDKMLEHWDLDRQRSVQQRDKIKRRALALLNKLHDWRLRWNSDERNSYSETIVASDELGEGSAAGNSPSFLTTFEFSNASSATMFMFYNTTLIYVLRILASLPSGHLSLSLSQDTQNTALPDNLGNLSKDEYLALERCSALEVCRCVPFDLVQKSSVNFCISPIGHWAITTAWMTLHGSGSVEERWMMDLLSENSREAVAKGVWE